MVNELSFIPNVIAGSDDIGSSFYHLYDGIYSEAYTCGEVFTLKSDKIYGKFRF